MFGPSKSVQRPRHLLLVEDDPVDVVLLLELLRGLDEVWTHKACASIQEAISMLESESFDLLLMDLGLPDNHDLDGCQEISRKFPTIPIVLLTGRDDRELAEDALLGSVQDYLVKGKFQPSELERVLRHAVARAQADQNLRTALEVCADGIMVCSNGSVLFANDSLEKVLGDCSLDLAAHQFEIASEPEWTLPDGRTLETRQHPIEWGGRPSVLYSFRDITPRKVALAQAARAEKLAAVGKLAGGIAQDFNNLLVGIKSQAEMIKDGILESDACPEAAREILLGAERAASLTSQLLGFAQLGKIQAVPVDLHELLRTRVEESQAQSENRTFFRLNLAANAVYVEGDCSQLGQVFESLIINAQEAMGFKGQLEIRSEIADSWTIIEFRDNGPGICPSVASRVFEPFSTTKTYGEGVGMGLAMAFGVIKAHGGTIEVNSPADGGCQVLLKLPTFTGLSSPQAVKYSPTNIHRKLVLVIDDDPLVLRTVSRLLKRLGLDSVCAGGGEEGLKEFRERLEEIQLVLLDWRMPQMDGEAVLKQLREIDASVPVMIISGFTEDSVHKPVEGLLRKPFGFQEFQEATAPFVGI